MSESPEISVAFLSSTDSMTLSRMSVGGKLYVVLSTEIAVPVDGFPSLMELINAKHVTLRATSSA